ncbi:MAG: hypothetical protein ACREIQ_05405, partial [Nitrospiria bacterium]
LEHENYASHSPQDTGLEVLLHCHGNPTGRPLLWSLRSPHEGGRVPSQSIGWIEMASWSLP